MNLTKEQKETKMVDAQAGPADVTLDPPSRPAEGSAVDAQAKRIDAENLNIYYGDFLAVKDVSVKIHPNKVTALIGSSGCGKSTFLRSLNRMHELIDGARVEGRVLLDGNDIYARNMDPVLVRQQVGMVFQQPNPFPTMSIYENTAAGLRLNRRKMKKTEMDGIVERSLRGAHLWEEVKDRLDKPGGGLSGGQQQRLCIARTLAVNPKIILMDEPCSALDPIATAKIEELIDELRANYSIIIVTHSMSQAARVSQRTAFFHLGDLVEVGETEKIFTNPQDERTHGYITGRFG